MPYDGYYKIEAWGAGGGYGFYQMQRGPGGYGSYSAGEIKIKNNSTIYIFIGAQGTSANSYSHVAGGWNGEGDGTKDGDGNDSGGGGGGASDIRLTSGAWNNANSLRSRIMVASGGGGSSYGDSLYYQNSTGRNGGGLYNAGSIVDLENTSVPFVANQTSGHAFGSGYSSTDGTPYLDAVGGCGSGWYGGKITPTIRGSAGAGGSSYISGHTGSVAVTSTSSSSPKSGCTTGTTDNACSITPYINPATGSGYTFTNTVMIDGAGYAWTNTKGSLQQMPNPNGGYYASGVGHSGNGAARITYLGTSI